MRKQRWAILMSILIAALALIGPVSFLDRANGPSSSVLAAPQAAPTVTTVNPASAPNDLDMPIVITGTGSTAGLTVTLGSTPLSEAVKVSSTPLTLNLNLGPSDPTIDPALASDGPSRFVINQLFLGLVRLNDDTGEPLPELATSWEMSPDATVFTFTLRNGITWTDGSPVTAYDVRYSILRSLDLVSNPDVDFPLFLIQNAQDYYEGTITDTDQVGITVLDYTHIRFSLNQAAAYFPGALADQPTARTMPQWAIEAHGVPTWTQPTNIVSNGPYRLTAWTHGVSMTLEKNTDYYDAANVQIDRVALQMLGDITAWGMYQAQQLDSVRVPESEWSANLNDPLRRQELHFASQPAIYYYGFNTAKAPFTSTLVRKAFIAAVNRQGIIDDVRRYAERPALTYTPPGIWGHVDGFAEGVGIPYNPTQAQQWLAAAGYPNGQGLPPVTLVYITSTLNQALAQYVRQNWIDNLGVTVTLSYTNPSDYYRLLRTDPPQIWRLTCLPFYYDAYDFLNVCVYYYGRAPYGNWTNPTYDALLSLAARTADLDTRKSLYKQAEEILVETDAVELPVYYGANGIAAKPYLQRTYGSGGFGGHIADWRITRVITLSAALSADRPVVATGERLTYTLLLSNTGNATTWSTAVTNPIPSGASYVANTAWASSGVINDVSGITWQGTVTPGQTITVTYNVSITAPAGSVITNTATISDSELAAPVVVSTTTNVTYGALANLAITPTSVTLGMRQQQQFTATGFDTYGNAVPGLALSWQVAQPDAGTIDITGLFTAGIKAGIYPDAVIVLSGVFSDTADVTVRWSYQIYLPLVLR